MFIQRIKCQELNRLVLDRNSELISQKLSKIYHQRQILHMTKKHLDDVTDL